MTRIKSLGVSAADIICDMSDGNPGALNAMIMLVERAETIDPDSTLGEFAPLFSLDTLGIYGSRIWIFFKDVCERCTHTMIGLMRANQMGYVTDAELKAAIDDGAALDIPALLAKVKERLPAFQLPPEKSEAA